MKNRKIIFQKTNWLLIFFIFLSSLSFFTTVIYYLHSLNLAAIILSLLLTSLVTVYSVFYLFKEKEKTNEGGDKEANDGDDNDKKKKEALLIESLDKKNKNSNTNKVLVFFQLALPLLFIALSFRQLILASFETSLISPWQEIAPVFFVLYGLALVSLIFFFKQKNKNTLKKIYLILFYFLSFSVCLISYKLGYGFDPFIHQASMEYIAKHGFILPKTPYYLGEYGLIIAINKISGLSIYFLNKIFVPFLAALSIPLLSWDLLKNCDLQANKKSWLISIVSLLSIVFTPFILTTPQSLSYIFLMATIILTANSLPLLLSLLLALATLAIHPLSGLPALGFVSFLFYNKYKKYLKNKFQKYFSLVLLIIFNSLALPLSLFIGGGKSLSINNLLLSIKLFFVNLIKIDPSKSQSLVLNISNFFSKNIALLISILLISALIFFYKKQVKTFSKKLNNYFKALTFSIYSLFISYFLSSLIVFNDVITYEQSAYSQRILILIIIFSLPFIIDLINEVVKRVLKKDQATRIIYLFLLLILILSSLYNSYPRFDKYNNSRGYNTSHNDLQAVQEVELMANEEYLVLANQQVSAAALKLFGFNNYLKTEKEELYFYPIPTGGKLYDFYLQAVYNGPSKKNMLQAMNLAEVNESYLIINKYWHRSAELINEAKLEANSHWNINNEVFIFQYLR